MDFDLAGLIFWFLFLAGLLGTAGCLAASLRVVAYYRPQAVEPDSADNAGLSMVVPIKGADERTFALLDRLVQSQLDGPVEYLFAMETEQDPAYPVCRQVQERNPDRDVRIILAGPAGERMGKQHNLARAFAAARYESLGSMDADVEIDPGILAIGLAELNASQAGFVFALAYYAGRGPLGGELVALYTNYSFSLFIGNLATWGRPDFIIGALWLTARQALNKIGGLDQFTAVVSDDPAIGRASARAGLRNRSIRHPVRLVYEQLSFTGGLRHLQKWVAMLRAEGILRYTLISLFWHPVLWSGLACLAGIGLASPAEARLGAGLLLASLGVRAGSIYLLDRFVYRTGDRLRHILLALLFELFVVPFVFGYGWFNRNLTWRGRRYRIGYRGRIEEVYSPEP